MTTAAIPMRRRLGKYELVARIGEGGMAEVFLARQFGPRRFEKLVVVKTVRAALASRPELAAMLLDEARIAAMVKHPNVVDIYDLGDENGTFFIAMEYLEGESLAQILKGSRPSARLDPFSTARVIADGAAGLHAAHELRSLAGEPMELVHQDVSPGNVIVLYTGQVKLVDFGVAKVRTSGDDGLLKGKTGYLAPELLDGAPADRRSDVFALGVVLWEALTLKRLFGGRTEDEAIAKIRAGDVPAPSRLVAAVPRDLDEVCFNALARDPAKRYASAASMHADLQQILRHASWSGGTEPIARFMRATFADRIAARADLLRELATRGEPHGDTLDRVRVIPESASPPMSAEERAVIGAHGVVRPLPTPAAGVPELGAPDDVVVELRDVEVEPEPLLAAEELAAAAPPRRRRNVLVAAILGGAAVGAIGAAFALAPGRSGEGAASGATVTPGPAAAREGGDDAEVEPAAGAEPVAAAEPAAEPATEPATEPEPVGDPEAEAGGATDPVAEPALPDRGDRGDRGDRRRGDRRRDERGKVAPGDPTDPVGPAVGAAATAKALYKEGLQRFVAGDVDGAIRLFDQARAKDRGYAPTYRGLGMAYEKRGDRRRAAQAFARYLELAPGAPDATQIRERLEKLR